MYNQATKIININQYKVSNNTLAYKDKNSNVFRNFFKVSECGYDDIFIIGQSIFFNDKEGNVLKINQNQEVFKEKSTLLNFSSDVIASNQLVYLDSLENLNLFDLNSKLDHNLNGINYNWENIFLSNNESTIFLIGNTSIHAYTLPTATPLWQYDLGSLGIFFEPFHQEEKPYELLKFLGVWQNELLVACSNGLILCLNIATGKETRRFHQCPTYQLGSHTNTSFDSSDVFQLKETANKLIALYAYFYMEIDLGTSEISIYPLDDVMKKNNLSFFRRSLGYALDGELIYTIGEVGNHISPISKGDRCILAFDIKTKDVVWQYIFEGDSVNTDIPQYANNKLYQLTSSNNLFIFEKE